MGGPVVWTGISDLVYQAKTTTYTAVFGELVSADTSGGAWTLTLPTAVGNTGRRIGAYLKTAGNKLTLDPNGSQTIRTRSETATTIGLWVAGDLVVLVSDGANWVAIVDNLIPHQARMTRDAAQSINNNTATRIQFDNTDYDNASIATEGASAQFVIKRAGKYRIEATWRADGIDDTEYALVYILLNATSINTHSVRSTSADQPVDVYCEESVTLVVNDAVRLDVQHIEGAAINTNTNGQMKPRMTVTEIR